MWMTCDYFRITIRIVHLISIKPAFFFILEISRCIFFLESRIWKNNIPMDICRSLRTIIGADLRGGSNEFCGVWFQRSWEGSSVTCIGKKRKKRCVENDYSENILNSPCLCIRYYLKWKLKIEMIGHCLSHTGFTSPIDVCVCVWWGGVVFEERTCRGMSYTWDHSCTFSDITCLLHDQGNVIKNFRELRVCRDLL